MARKGTGGHSEKGQGEPYINFDEYIRQGEPGRRELADAWRVAIGLQAVDGLKTSAYLQTTARRNIEGDITIDEAKALVNQYYISKTARAEGDDDAEQADRVSANISKLLLSDGFTYSAGGFAAIHRAIFEGVFKHAGRFRTYDIAKREWVLRGDSVLYGRWQDLRMTIDYDLEQERRCDYAALSQDQMVEHMAQFVAGLWQIHPFSEGNTRTTAIFTIKYLRSQGFSVNNDMFERHSWYFRNALVRANYRNVAKGIGYAPVFLERFFRNLLLGENHVLKNRYMIIDPPKEWRMPEAEVSTPQVTYKHPTSAPQASPQAPKAYPALQPNDSGVAERPSYYAITPQVPYMNPATMGAAGENLSRLLGAIAHRQLSVKEMLTRLELKDRKNFVELFLNPAIAGGYVCMLYPDKPRHPRQRYMLTPKGIGLYNEVHGERFSP